MANALYRPHLLTEKRYSGKFACWEKTFNTKEHWIEVLVALSQRLLERSVNLSSARKKVRLPCAFCRIMIWILLFQGRGICNQRVGSKYCRSRFWDDLHETKAPPYECEFWQNGGRLKCYGELINTITRDTVETENSIGQLGIIPWKGASFRKGRNGQTYWKVWEAYRWG